MVSGTASRKLVWLSRCPTVTVRAGSEVGFGRIVYTLSESVTSRMISSGLITRGLVLIGALVTGPLYAQSVATEANKELRDWLQIGGLYRARFEGFLS